MLPQNNFLQFLFLLYEEDKVLQETEKMRDVAKRLDLRFEVPDFVVLPIEDISPHRVPCHAEGETDGFRRRENHFRRHHLWRFSVITANLIDSERDSFIFRRVLALDHEHRDTVDEKHNVFTCAVAAVVDVELLCYFIDVAPLLTRPIQVAVIDQRQVKLAVLLRAEKLSLIAQIVQKLSIPSDACVQPLKLAHQRALGFFVFRVEHEHLLVKQIAKVKRRRPSTVFRRRTIRIKAALRFGLGARDKFPPDLLRVF
jgi:hypothetical protein